jgi:hypothetical protein
LSRKTPFVAKQWNINTTLDKHFAMAFADLLASRRPRDAVNSSTLLNEELDECIAELEAVGPAHIVAQLKRISANHRGGLLLAGVSPA